MNKYEMMSPKERQKLGIVRGKVSGKLYPKEDIKKYESLETKRRERPRRERPQIVNSKTNKDGSRTITYDDNSFKTVLKDKTIRSGGPIFDNNKKIISKKFEDGGDVKKDGKSRFIMPNADYDLNDPNFMRFIKRKMKKETRFHSEVGQIFNSETSFGQLR